MRIISIVLGLSLALVAARASSQSDDPAWPQVLDKAAFDSLRIVKSFDSSRALNAPRNAAFQAAALTARGFTGPKDYLQGCDLEPPGSSAEAARARLAQASTTYPEYVEQHSAIAQAIALERRQLGAAVPPRSVAEAAERDQLARRGLSATMPTLTKAGAEALMTARLNLVCEVDLANGAWLQSNFREAVPTVDIEVGKAAYTIAIHADHLPDLQRRLGVMFLGRGRHGGPWLEAGARLLDRAAINIGQDQIFGTAMICEDGEVRILGNRRDEEWDLFRSEYGLPTFPTAYAETARNCGSDRTNQ